MRFISRDTLIKMQNYALWKGLTFFFPSETKMESGFFSDSCDLWGLPGNLFMSLWTTASLLFKIQQTLSLLLVQPWLPQGREQEKSIPFTGFFQNIDHLPGLAFANESILETQGGAVEAPCKNKNKYGIYEEERCRHGEECSVWSISIPSLGGQGGRTLKLPGQHRLSLLLL